VHRAIEGRFGGLDSFQILWYARTITFTNNSVTMRKLAGSRREDNALPIASRLIHDGLDVSTRPLMWPQTGTGVVPSPTPGGDTERSGWTRQVQPRMSRRVAKMSGKSWGPHDWILTDPVIGTMTDRE
jgi:hypothetical protein